MQIEWITVVAQIVNFLILVWLLQRFLYKPIVNAMDERERKIAARLEDAETKRAAADKEKQALEAERRTLANAREDALSEAREQAETLRRDMERQARAEVDEKRTAARAQLARESDEFLETLRRTAADQFEALARAALGDLADASLEERVAAAFAARLQELDANERAVLAEAAASAGGVSVESAFDLDAGARDRVTRAIHETIAPALDVTFARVDRLILGVRMRAGGRVAQWSLDAYLDRFRDELGETLEHETSAAAGGKAAE